MVLTLEPGFPSSCTGNDVREARCELGAEAVETVVFRIKNVATGTLVVDRNSAPPDSVSGGWVNNPELSAGESAGSQHVASEPVVFDLVFSHNGEGMPDVLTVGITFH